MASHFTVTHKAYVIVLIPTPVLLDFISNSCPSHALHSNDLLPFDHARYVPPFKPLFYCLWYKWLILFLCEKSYNFLLNFNDSLDRITIQEQVMAKIYHGRYRAKAAGKIYALTESRGVQHRLLMSFLIQGHRMSFFPLAENCKDKCGLSLLKETHLSLRIWGFRRRLVM